MSFDEIDVAVVGAGPVGLYLAALLARRGVRVRVLERRREADRASRAIGVHPPALAALDEIGAAKPLLARGARVRFGAAYAGAGGTALRPLGRLDLRRLPGPHRFVLCVPQPETEAVLEARLRALAPDGLRRGARVEAVERTPAGIAVRGVAGGAPFGVRARALALCDGAGGELAGALGFGARGRPYPDTYLMADVRDEGPFARDEAAVVLARDGVVEAFPLPGGRRRWVARTGAREAEDPVRLAELVRARTGARFDPATTGMVSAFGTRWRQAAPLAAEGVWLVGDAAHVVSPIGGQGMNLGWLGARAAAAGIAAALSGGNARAAEGRYDRAQRARARGAVRRAAWNMRLGRPVRLPWARDALVAALLSPPLAPWSARLFTMQA